MLDRSVALAWYFKDEAVSYADQVAGAFPAAQAVVPTIWPLEIANAVLMGERRGVARRRRPASGLAISVPCPLSSMNRAMIMLGVELWPWGAHISSQLTMLPT